MRRSRFLIRARLRWPKRRGLVDVEHRRTDRPDREAGSEALHDPRPEKGSDTVRVGEDHHCQDLTSDTDEQNWAPTDIRARGCARRVDTRRR